MSDKWDVTSLIEMGIDHDVAMDAMRRVNGNLEDAVNFIFSNELPAHLVNNNDNNDSVPIDLGSVHLPHTSSHSTSNNTDNNNNADSNHSDDVYTTSDPDLDMTGHPLNTLHLQQTGLTAQQPLETDYVLSSSSSSTSILSRTNENFNRDNDVNSYDDNIEESMDNLNDEQQPPSYSVMQHSIHKTEVSDPTILTPLPVNSTMENYLALYALAMAYYAPSLFLSPDFKNLNYNEEWYKGNSLVEPLYKLNFLSDHPENTVNAPSETLANPPHSRKTEIKESSKIENPSYTQPETLWQLQRLIAACDSKFSERAFISAKVITKSFDSNVVKKLAEGEHVHEVLPVFIKSLITDLELCPNADLDKINEAFVSTAIYKPSKDGPFEETYLTLFHFLPEEYDSTLYRMFNVLLYPEESSDDLSDSEDEDEDDQRDSSLKTISPIFTVLLSEMDETTNENMAYKDGIDIPFEFYPQLYTKDCKDQLIKHIIEKRNTAHFELRSILNDLNKLKSYQGKDIFMFLNSTLEYLQQDEKMTNEKSKQILSIISQIETIKTQMNEKKETKKEQYKEISQKLHHEWNLTYPEKHIINTAKQLNLIDYPYLLSMVVISPFLYFLRDRNDKNKWTQVKCNKLGSDFQLTNSIAEEQLMEYIKDHTKNPNETPIMFTYVKEDFYDEQQASLAKTFEKNEGCQQFHKADQLYLLSTK
ncbi:hypothetical protein C6P45_005311 [Maudiozyma exigua]|uniref:UBA domain-containing protein n=1 Tax=Maudiozyma exigua TaxID=34358 RepID=A0A9P7BBA7_MAUEX|nr:hypothetical protein C6P45_005311 [Kazachstania exigua]